MPQMPDQTASLKLLGANQDPVAVYQIREFDDLLSFFGATLMLQSEMPDSMAVAVWVPTVSLLGYLAQGQLLCIEIDDGGSPILAVMAAMEHLNRDAEDYPYVILLAETPEILRNCSADEMAELCGWVKGGNGRWTYSS